MKKTYYSVLISIGNMKRLFLLMSDLQTLITKWVLGFMLLKHMKKLEMHVGNYKTIPKVLRHEQCIAKSSLIVLYISSKLYRTVECLL